jgi:iron-sulfur cluster assembly protein
MSSNVTILEITPRAVERAKQLIARQETPARGIRVGVRGGGCSGLSYVVKPETAEKKGDVLVDVDGLIVFVDAKSQLFLLGTVLDWEDTLMQSGFKFTNPNARRSCSCGESFTV